MVQSLLRSPSKRATASSCSRPRPPIADVSRPRRPGSCISARWSPRSAAGCSRARAGGRWIVRIEDLDPPREVAGADAEILATLAAFGMESDEPPIYQSRRASELRRGFRAARSALRASFPAGAAAAISPPSTARIRAACVAPTDRSRDPAWRLRVPDAHDRIRRCDPGPHRAAPSTRCRRFRRAARRRLVRLSARRRRRRRGRKASPTSCAAPTCSTRRRARSTCSELLGLPHVRYAAPAARARRGWAQARRKQERALAGRCGRSAAGAARCARVPRPGRRASNPRSMRLLAAALARFDPRSDSGERSGAGIVCRVAEGRLTDAAAQSSRPPAAERLANLRRTSMTTRVALVTGGTGGIGTAICQASSPARGTRSRRTIATKARRRRGRTRSARRRRRRCDRARATCRITPAPKRWCARSNQQARPGRHPDQQRRHHARHDVPQDERAAVAGSHQHQSQLRAST